MTTRYFHNSINQNKFRNKKNYSNVRKVRYNIRVPNSFIRKITKAEKIKQQLKIKRKQALIRKLVKEIKEEQNSLEYTDEMYIPLEPVLKTEKSKQKIKTKNNKKKIEKTQVRYLNKKRTIDPETSMMMTLTFFSVIYYLVSKWIEL